MPVPPDPVLRAALRWLEHLPTSDVARTRTLFTTSSAFSDITPTQYAAALTWLEERGLLKAPVPAVLLPATVFGAAIREALWFADADALITGPEDIPEDALRASRVLCLSADESFAIVRHVWGKVDTAERERIGSAGELALVKLLAGMPDVEVQHVAAESDGYGYDIGVTMPSTSVHLEVKSTLRRGRLRIFLSRNEYETMRRDPVWALIAVRLDQELQIAALGTISRNWLMGAAPLDRQPGARWESVRLDVPVGALTSGIPAVLEAFKPPHPPVVQGTPRWPG